MADEQDPPIHPFYHLARNPEFQAFLANHQANSRDPLPMLVAADWLEERGHPDFASIIRRHYGMKPKISKFVRPGIGVHARTLASVVDPTSKQEIGVHYEPWSIEGKRVHGLSFSISDSSTGHGIGFAAPATGEEVQRVAQQYGAPGTWEETDHRMRHSARHEDPEPDQLAATSVVPQSGNSVIVRVPLPQQTQGSPAPSKPAAQPVPAPAQQPQAPQARSFILPV